MVDLLIHLVATVLLLFMGYLVSVFFNAIYIDPEEIRTFFPEISERRRQQLERFISNPRAFFQVAFLVRISSAIALGILALQTAHRLASFHLLPAPAIYILIFAVYWTATLVLFIYLPRRISRHQAKARLIRFLPPINFIYMISSPVIALFGKISSKGTPDEVPEEQKEDIVERAIETLAESAGISSPIIEEDEKEMIQHIFQLDVTEVEEIMIPRVNVIGIEKNADLHHISDLVRKHGFSRYPVFEESIDNIIGIIYVKDLLLLNRQQREKFNLTNHMREPLRVGEHKKIDQLLTEFKKTKRHIAIVMDEFGGTAGLATLEDILEEIVGEIEDEHDIHTEQAITRLGNGTLEVSGACPLEDLAEELQMEIQQEEFETVGGMIYDMVGSIPAEGTSLAWENCRLKVLEVKGQRINKVLVVPPPPATY